MNEDFHTNLATILRTWKVEVVEESGWPTRGALPFTPQGVMVHHTAGPHSDDDAPNLRRVRDTGRHSANDFIPPPMCNILLARSGVAHVVAAYRANHAGSGNSQVLEEVRQDIAPANDAGALHLPDNANGNRWFYGIEVENTGLPDDAYPTVQIEALIRCCAGLCVEYGWSSARVIHHREWTYRKDDMSYRGLLRSDVHNRMGAGP